MKWIKIITLKKEIKAIKKDITENGIYNRGFYWSIKDEITFDDIMEILDTLRNEGFNVSEIDGNDLDTFIVYEILSHSNYQDFKNRYFKYIY